MFNKYLFLTSKEFFYLILKLNKKNFFITSFLNILISIIFGLTTSSCLVIGVNLKHKTPSKPFIYPSFTRCDSLRGYLSNYRACYDVKFYELFIDFDINKKSIDGKVIVTAQAKKNFNRLQIDLYKNMYIDSILYNEEKLPYTRECNAVFIDFPKYFTNDDFFSFTVFYHGKPQIARRPPWEGGFVWRKDKRGKPWVGVACELYGSSLWWPSKDHLTDEPDSMLMHYTVPKGLNVIANGNLIDSISLNDKTTYTWKVSYPINTYNTTFYIGDFENFSIPYSSDSSNFMMNFFVHEENINLAKVHFEQAKSVINCFEKFYGAYPFPRDGYKLVESPFAGMEHQSAIAYGNNFNNNSYSHGDYIMIHETAHEWWGNSVTATDYAEIWLHEGFATYSEALFVEMQAGYEEYLKFLAIYSVLIKNKRPIIGPYDVNYWDYKDADVYMKGALLLHTLRNTIGNDSVFFDILKTFYQNFKYGSAKTKDFIEIVNNKTKKDYTSFFNQYLYSRVCPTLLWEFNYDIITNQTFIYYRWKENVNNDFTIPITIQVNEKNVTIWPTKELKRTELPYAISIKLNTKGSYISLKRTKKF